MFRKHQIRLKRRRADERASLKSQILSPSAIRTKTIIVPCWFRRRCGEMKAKFKEIVIVMKKRLYRNIVTEERTVSIVDATCDNQRTVVEQSTQKDNWKFTCGTAWREAGDSVLPARRAIHDYLAVHLFGCLLFLCFVFPAPTKKCHE